MDLSEQIATAAHLVATCPDEEASQTYRSNLQFLVSTAATLGQDVGLIDLSEAIQAGATALVSSSDEEKSRTLRANLKFLVEATGAVSAVAPVESAPARLVDPGEELLTTTQAAALLDVSRTTLMKLIESGEVDHVMVGSHHRIPIQSVRSYRRARLVSREDVGGADRASRSPETTSLYRPTVQFGEDDLR